MRFLTVLMLILSTNSLAENMASLGYEFISGIEDESDGNTGLIKLSYMHHIAKPIFIGGDLAFNIEQLIFDDISSRRYEHEAYFNLNIGVLNNINNLLVGYAYIGANIASLERDLPLAIETEEDVTEEGKVVGVGFGVKYFDNSILNLTFSRIDNGEGFVFTGININLSGLAK